MLKIKALKQRKFSIYFVTCFRPFINKIKNYLIFVKIWYFRPFTNKDQNLSPTKTKTCLSKHIVPNEAFVVDIQSIILQEAPEAKKVKSRTNKSMIEINVTFTTCCSFSNEDQNDRHRGFIKFLRWPALRIALLYISHELPQLLPALTCPGKINLSNWKMANLTFLRDPP